LEGERFDVAAADERRRARRLLPDEYRPQLGQCPRVFQEERVADGRAEDVELVIALEPAAARLALEGAGDGRGDTGEELLAALQEPVAAAGRLVDDTTVEGLG